MADSRHQSTRKPSLVTPRRIVTDEVAAKVHGRIRLRSDLSLEISRAAAAEPSCVDYQVRTAIQWAPEPRRREHRGRATKTATPRGMDRRRKTASVTLTKKLEFNQAALTRNAKFHF